MKTPNHRPPLKTLALGLLLAASAARADVGVGAVVADLDSRDYTLTVASDHGNPTPPVGTASYAWHATVTCRVQSVVVAGPTQYVCTGWTGAGSIPASGATTNTGALLLTNLASSIAWQWVAQPVPPVTNLAPAYRVVDLGDIPGGADSSYAYKVNDSGQVIGQGSSAIAPALNAAFIWDVTNGMRDLGRITGDSSSANAINNKGVVVGDSWNSHSGWSQAFRWDAVNNIQWQGPGAIAGYPYYGVSAINDNGALSYHNWSFDGPPSKVYFISSGGIATNIGEIYPNSYSAGLALNNKNEMVGHCAPSHYGDYQAFFWSSYQGIIGLGFLPGFTRSVAWSINDTSQVVGTCDQQNSITTAAFIWTAGSGMTQLGTSGIGGSNSAAYTISAGGIAVGNCTIAGTSRAVAWAPGQDAVDLNTRIPDLSGWTSISMAYGINASGMIVGYGMRTNGAQHACILYPITSAVISIGPYYMQTTAGQAGSLPAAKLIRSASTAHAGTHLTLSLPGSTSVLGGEVQFSNDLITYTPPNIVSVTNFTDTFSYTLTADSGASATGTVTVLVTIPSGNSPNVVDVSSSGDQVTVTFAGIPNFTYAIQASTNLLDWTTIGTATAGPNGLFQFTDVNAGQYSTRFYRTASP